jgi:alpha-glucosidase
MLAAVRFWLERGVDGFRIDVAHFIMKDPELRDQPPAQSRRGLPHKPPSEYDTQEHLYDKGHPDIHQVFRKIRSVIDEFEPSSPRYSVGEIHEFDWVKWASYFGDNDELHMPFNFALLLTGLEASAVHDAIADLEAVLPKGAWPNWVMGNHDEPRLATRLGRDQSRAAAFLLLTLRGTPTIYYGDELGMPEAVIPQHMVKDPWGHRMPGFSRDGCRTPMQWNAGPNAGFSTAGETWLPVQPASIINVESELADPGSHLVLYRRLLSVRRAEPSLRAGDIALTEGLPPSCLGYTRHAPGSRPLTVLLNLSGEPVELAWTGQVLASSVPGEPMLGRLRAWEGLILA